MPNFTYSSSELIRFTVELREKLEQVAKERATDKQQNEHATTSTTEHYVDKPIPIKGHDVINEVKNSKKNLTNRSSFSLRLTL